MNESAEIVKVEITNAPSLQDKLVSQLLISTATVVVGLAGTALTNAMKARAAKKAKQIAAEEALATAE